MIPLRTLLLLSVLLSALVQSPVTAGRQPAAAAGSITVDAASSGPPIPSSLYGIFFEEISHAGDGGLYAELIQNRGVERLGPAGHSDARLPPMCTLEKGLSLKARKISGAEGFIIPVGLADGRRVQWNVGGWGNRRHAVQVTDAVVGEFTPGSVETGRWYDIRVEVRDRTVRGFLDGVLVQERTLPRIDKVLSIAGRDDKTGDIVIKVVNSAPDAAPMSVVLKGVTGTAAGR